MRPLSYYAIFEMGAVTAIATGAVQARALSPHRGYRPFRTRLEAEEFAMWWNHDHPQWWTSTKGQSPETFRPRRL